MNFSSLSKMLLVACSLLALSAAAVHAADMQYISREDFKKSLTSEQNPYIVLDLRKIADYEKAHMATAASADMDPTMGITGSNAAGIATLKKILKEKTGDEKGAGKQIVLLCYSGARYAQKGTDLLAEIGADTSKVYTMKGGYKALTADEAGEEYKKLMVSGKEAGALTK